MARNGLFVDRETTPFCGLGPSVLFLIPEKNRTMKLTNTQNTKFSSMSPICCSSITPGCFYCKNQNLFELPKKKKNPISLCKETALKFQIFSFQVGSCWVLWRTQIKKALNRNKSRFDFGLLKKNRNCFQTTNESKSKL